MVETCSQLAGACLEQTTWLRRNLAVREDASPEPQPTTPSPTSSMTRVDTAVGANYRYSLQAQNVLAELLAPLLDVAFGSQDKERVVALLTGVLANITPYLRNHSVRNSVSFRACSQLLASVSGYQYTRRAWKKEALELLLDPAFFQMEPQCLPSWKAIVDNLMAHDTTTFRDLLAKVSMPQSGSLSLFSSKEQELEQRAQLLKRLAFVLFCGEIDQYQKHMHEIQERLADCLRLPQAVPSLQAQVFLCFRVLLMRMSSHHVTSLWPIVISELVQAMLHMEHQLTSGSSEHLRAHLRLLSGLDAAWALDNSNGLNSTGHPAWLALQLAACKLLDLMLALPASRLPQFTMYRWAFVGDFDNTAQNGDLVREEREEREVSNSMRCTDFIPHVKRLSKLLDAQVSAGASFPVMLATPGQPLLHVTSIHSLQQLQGFFSSLAVGTRPSINAASSDWEQAVEQVLDNDFLEPLPSK
ncbi:UNVERIFIED_CONTAM: hypothetical protein B566_EDAN019404 [Ephemera danica]|nr:hypothetical protein B566_EDAN019404 [Ephemera danica]